MNLYLKLAQNGAESFQCFATLFRQWKVEENSLFCMSRGVWYCAEGQHYLLFTNKAMTLKMGLGDSLLPGKDRTQNI